MKLKDIQIKNAKPKGNAYKLSDGEGLYLLCNPSGSKLWSLKYRYANKEKTLSIGEYPLISLSEAREEKIKAKSYFCEILTLHKEKQRVKRKIYIDSETTFKAVAEKCYEKEEKSWSKHHSQKVWRRVEVHIIPAIGMLMFTSKVT